MEFLQRIKAVRYWICGRLDAAVAGSLPVFIHKAIFKKATLDIRSDKKTPSQAMQSESRDAIVVQTIDQDPIAARLERRRTFIPLRYCDLKLKIAQTLDLEGTNAHDFKLLCERLQSVFHAEHLSSLLRLEELYGPLDPDDDSIEINELPVEARNRRVGRLLDEVSGLLYSAHYKKLSKEEIQRAVSMGSQWGVKLEVDFELYDRLEIFARGYRVVEARRRRWQNLYREEVIELPEFQRLIMAFRLKSDQDMDEAMDASKVYLKTFKNIPETDLEILLPGSKIKLSMMDRGKIIFPTISGAAIAIFKLLRGAVVLAVAFTLKSILVWLLFLGAIIGYFVKSVLSYFRTKKNYQFGLTRSLYLKNLDNNSSVIFRILNEAEEQELLETILCFMLLWDRTGNDRASVLSNRNRSVSRDYPEGMTEEEIDLVVERYLIRETGVDVDFEIHDALGKLARLGLVDVDDQGRWSTVEIGDAVDRLNANWEKLFRLRPPIAT